MLRRDPRWTLVLALFAMMWAAHALTFLEARYLYVKLPTIIAAFRSRVCGRVVGRPLEVASGRGQRRDVGGCPLDCWTVRAVARRLTLAAIRTDPANSRNPGSRSNTLPAPPTTGMREAGVAGCSQSKGVITTFENPARSSRRRSSQRTTAVSSGDTYGNQLRNLRSIHTCGFNRLGSANTMRPPGAKSLLQVSMAAGMSR